MIVSRNAGGFEFARLRRADLAKRHANFHAELADFANRLQDLLEFFRAVAHPAPGCAHAKARRALSSGFFCKIDNALDRQELFALEPSGIMSALRAIRAVLAAAAG